MHERYPPIAGLPVIMEDSSIILVDKPSGMLSQPGKSMDGSVLSRILESGRQLHGPVLVHRLDMDTSGLMILAKTRDYHRHLQQQFERRLIIKRYRARLQSAIRAHGGRIALPLRLDIDDRPRQIVCHVHGKACNTLWHRTSLDDDCAVTFYPLTGRTHQLRVHAAQGLGVPIAGDRLYGITEKEKQNSFDALSVASNRLMLHADYLQFQHPETGEQRRIFCPSPF